MKKREQWTWNKSVSSVVTVINGEVINGEVFFISKKEEKGLRASFDLAVK
jgi:hypothetical protein